MVDFFLEKKLFIEKGSEGDCRFISSNCPPSPKNKYKVHGKVIRDILYVFIFLKGVAYKKTFFGGSV